MRMQKVQFRIGQLAKQLNIEKFVIRFWEKEFNLSTNRSHGGQRFYSQEDFEQFKMIKSLLYEQGFTIAGAKKYLESPAVVVGSRKTTLQKENKQELQNQLLDLRKQLVQLRELL
ncbi:MAG TPA: MerR family transcriptional regulator [Candidatus Babeliales bacterium]|nr:MerR family transcriptional regulator [Candidatus Babeliales bacterium]